MKPGSSKKARENIIKLFANSVHSHSTAHTDQIDDEEIALLATGQLDKLPPARRKQLLHQVATDPVAARLVKDIHSLNLDESVEAQRSMWRSSPRLRSVTVAWALAACLMMGLFLWRVVDPTPPVRGAGTVQVYGETQEPPDYWSQLEKQRLAQQATYHGYREYALVATTTICLVLSVGLVACVVSLRRRQHKAENPA